MISPHRRGRPRLAWLIATVLLASCANHPPVRVADDSIRELRAEYLHSNPDGPFTRNIERGEVALGMGFEAVLAAWGIPATREHAGTDGQERWIYVLADDWSNDWTRYEFVFDHQSLASWETVRNVSSTATLSGAIPGATATPPPVPNSYGLANGGTTRR
ncbi:MAG TPA: hypothetical protein VFX92_10800 [Candidatus Krumholzibacteria bacterium]|nr:hypothetical protein [Candidatus Krumholzibacteria bacterium]